MFVHAHKGVTEGRGIGVVGALGAVHMVVGRAELVFSLPVSHEFQGPVGDDLVGVHVHGGAGAALHHVHRELVPKFSAHNLLAGCHDGVSNLLVQHAQLRIGGRGGHLHIGHGDDVLRIVAHLGVGDFVVVDGPLGLYAVVSVDGNLKFADEVAFDPEFLFRHTIKIMINKLLFYT